VSEKERDAKFSDCASTILDEGETETLLEKIKDIRSAVEVRTLGKATIPSS
jgi:hypothetical protein